VKRASYLLFGCLAVGGSRRYQPEEEKKAVTNSHTSIFARRASKLCAGREGPPGLLT
jgi:hypothetical protein